MAKLAAAGRIDAAGGENTRVLHRLDVREGPTGVGNDATSRVGIVVDVETTSTIVDLGAMIELAVRPFRFDRDGVITHIGRVHQWLEDPGTPLSPETTAITGLVDADVAGRCIDDEEAVRLLRSASIVVAHHAAFDRPWVERRLEGARGLDWACSFRQVDWRANGFDGRALGYLLQQTGWFHEGHRAGSDVDALLQLLRHNFPHDRTVLSVLLENAAMPSWIIRAEGAGFAAKDLLKARGYRWDPGRKVWWTEVSDDDRIAEEFWLAGNVYTAGAGARVLGPSYEQVTAAGRFL
ncbi:DNA polymerase III subunit epsilon [Sphingomonas sp. IC-56]|uniref:3'-5' exonuclease n=1 Tax=Sphingomonas sp. IC-56 TaxID=2898529 RepID=UPI001E54F3EC|nr:3'-5' exonuclease [Sphingomonas sp. IC-56]MCD2323058.1 DNA polymerase III subunit epsilon [Sphingomonas sp. IC-56]